MTNVQQAIADCKIDVPLYRIIEREDGTIQLTTRDAVFEWKPRPATGDEQPAPSRKARKRKS